MAAKDDRGRAGEDRAARHLTQLGYDILDRNWRVRQGELDIVAATARELVVVEVKTRRSEAYGHPFDAVDARKSERLWRLACAWVAAHPMAVRGRRIRLDVIGITGDDVDTAVLEHVEDLR
ncbi:YraN family protein [Microbacterium sp. cf332]|uniref:YraN family protein n=1 Tax=Microbacterium sp. cf332 TaxID=1761804 RepID=UPI0008902F1D|nr:YraN family protein [Microbacterium sp. cf332]SDQ11330.1 putative endonuclease [Microbacterium sp. cf332]